MTSSTHIDLRSRISIAIWLGVCAALVAAMVLLGGYTRLSGSGLSITEWKPIHGVIPPLSTEDWAQEFEAYRQSPQYQKVNQGMNLDEFKTIFWPEFFHRVLGRLVGIVFFIPFLFFLIRSHIDRKLALRLAGIFILGGLQGCVGWYMVKSGLVDNPRVSHLRLTLHLGMAFLIFGLLLWSMLDMLPRENPPFLPGKILRPFVLYAGLLFAQILLGGFMAGLHAGLIYNTWPDMNGQLVPITLTELRSDPWLENIALIQFLHRWVAAGVVASFLFAWWKIHNFQLSKRIKLLIYSCFFVVLLQFSLGVATLLMQVPLWLALKHQFVALILFGLSVALLHALKNAVPQRN